MPTLEPNKLPPLSDDQVKAGARPGESWEQARKRLDGLNRACLPAPIDEHPGADYTIAGPVDECAGLDGQPIQWESGELGRWQY